MIPTFSASDELVSFAAALNGQYEIEREIGRGGMGVVYLARDLRLDRMVAIKTLPAAMAADQVLRERFLREARTAARLNHPNIVPIHRADEAGGQVFFVMGYIDGDSLAGKLAGGAMSPRDALPILRDVAAALGYAHKHGIVHRDVKTENILLDAVTGRAMVTDFGIARVAAAAPLTATGQVLGTVYYLSPEQVADENVDARSDIYALGVVGFAMLAGRFPFDGNLASAVLIAHVVKLAPPLASLAPTVPAPLAAIIDKCLAKNPADRFQSCAELDAALEGVRAEANAVAIAPARGASPLISDTEAQQILGRAAQLDASKDAGPAQVRRRDPQADALRTDGFKTSVLRSAAESAGIDAAAMNQAFVEHGLRPMPAREPAEAGPPRNPRVDRRAVGVVHDHSKRGITESQSAHFEKVLEGEVPIDDHDLLVEIVRRHFAEMGSAGTIGRTLNCKGTTERGRTLDVSVQPRGGRTTIQVKETFGRIVQTVWAVSIVGVGLMGGGMISSSMENGAGLLIALPVSAILAAALGKGYAERREKAARKLIDELAEQAADSIRSAAPRRLLP